MAPYTHDATAGRAGRCDPVRTPKWAIRLLVVDTRRWLPGGQVLVPAARIASVHSGRSEVCCELGMEEIRNSPAYDPRQPVNVEYEKQLYDYYGRPKP